MPALPRCGIYRTTKPLGDAVPVGRLVYFHDHGDPGPGVYLPVKWKLNRAVWSERGNTIPDDEWARSLRALPREGLYRVREPFHCCQKECRLFEAGLLVQLGYDGEARPILFVPEWTSSGLAIPASGTLVDGEKLARLDELKVPEPREKGETGSH